MLSECNGIFYVHKRVWVWLWCSVSVEYSLISWPQRCISCFLCLSTHTRVRLTLSFSGGNRATIIDVQNRITLLKGCTVFPTSPSISAECSARLGPLRLSNECAQTRLLFPSNALPQDWPWPKWDVTSCWINNEQYLKMFLLLYEMYQIWEGGDKMIQEPQQRAKWIEGEVFPQEHFACCLGNRQLFNLSTTST